DGQIAPRDVARQALVQAMLLREQAKQCGATPSTCRVSSAVSCMLPVNPLSSAPCALSNRAHSDRVALRQARCTIFEKSVQVSQLASLCAAIAGTAGGLITNVSTRPGPAQS